jgi:hypothetical protein
MTKRRSLNHLAGSSSDACSFLRAMATEKKGRVRTYRLVPERLLLVESWLVRQRSLWEHRLDQLDEYLTILKEEQT